MGKMATKGELYSSYGVFSEGSTKCPTYLDIMEAGLKTQCIYEDTLLVDEDDITGVKIENLLTIKTSGTFATISATYPTGTSLKVGVSEGSSTTYFTIPYGGTSASGYIITSTGLVFARIISITPSYDNKYYYTY